MNRNVIIAVVIAAAALFAAVVFLLVQPDESQPGQAGAPAGEGRGWWDNLFGGGEDSEGIVDAPISPRQILFSSAAEYRERAKYPPNSFPITKENDPVQQDHAVSEMQLAHPNHPEGPYLVHYVAKTSFDPEEPLLVTAYLRNSDNDKVAPRGIKVLITQGGERGRILATVPLQDNGQAGDLRAGDLVFAASYRLPAEFARENAPPTNFIAVIVADTAEVGELRTTNAFNVGRLNIRHTGRFTDRIETDAKGAHLAIDVEVDVQKPGAFHLQGSVYNEDGEAIGWAQTRGDLQAGVQPMTLHFYGKMFCDSGESGPYILRYLNYMNVRQMPGPRSGIVEPNFKTQTYAANSFSCQDFNDPELLEKAKLLESEAEQEAL